MDRISQLPEHIIHHIQFFLPEKDAVKTCILSKAWKTISSLFPIIYLDHNLFASHHQEFDHDIISNKFMEFVDNQLAGLLVNQQSFRVRKLTLKVIAIDYSNHFPRIDQWMGLLKKCHNVEEMCLCVQSHPKNDWEQRWETDWIKDHWYVFPSQAFASKGLQVLSIAGCKFDAHKSFAGLSNFSSLKQLYLSYVLLDDEQVLSKLMGCFPLIEVLEFEYCRSKNTIKTLKLPNFPMLKRVSLQCHLVSRSHSTDFEIEATTLESLLFFGNRNMVCRLSRGAYRNIKELIVFGKSAYTPDIFQDLATNFPLLENAYFEIKAPKNGFDLRVERIAAVTHHHLRSLCISALYYELEEITIDSPCLREFSYSGCGVMEMSMNCPNLMQFTYSACMVPTISLFKSSLDIGGIEFVVDLIDDLNTSWFVNLGRFVDHVGSNGISLEIEFCSSMATFIEEEVDAIKVFPNREINLNVEILHKNMKGQAALVDGLLWSTHPTTLTLQGQGFLYDFLKHICDKLSNNKSQAWPSYCEKQQCSKHWWHYIKDFEVESDLGIEDIKGNLCDFVDRYRTTSFDEKISFNFFWV